MTDREFIENCGREIMLEKEMPKALFISRLSSALVRIEALVKANEDRDLTPEEANIEAKRLYGEGAWAQYSPFNPGGPFKFYRITIPKGDNPEWILSHGDSFRAAFALADKAEKDAKEGC